ncbi:MAG: hypothetical protein AABX70_06235 [Nanoarchaeota archaeon]
MTLDKLLDALRDYPDEELGTRLRVGENYQILLTGDFDAVERDLRASEQWRHDQELTDALPLGDLGRYQLFAYNKGVVVLQLMSWVVPCFVEGAEVRIESAHHNMSMMLVHGDEEKDLGGLSSQRVFADSIGDLGRYVRDHRIPASFPQSNLEGRFVIYDP